VAGIAFASGLLEKMAQKGQRLFLFGAKPGIAERAAEELTARYPGLVVCGTRDGYFKAEENEEIAETIRKADADVVFVCLGAPKQEFWMAKYGPATGAHLLVGLGGSLDVFAGTVERAPESWQKLGLEWLYRLKKEPWRWKRMIRLPLVLWYAVLARLGGKKHG
jgi:N-acetylglucosaminyldiphosphoundecaprenol N-acetyl-beta-D-mannosaminyltransferase